MILKALLQWNLESSPTTWTHISPATAINRFAHINNINLSSEGLESLALFVCHTAPVCSAMSYRSLLQSSGKFGLRFHTVSGYCDSLPLLPSTRRCGLSYFQV